MREISFEWNGKILVLSDIHYPHCNIEEINNIMLTEKPSLTVLLGDIIVSKGEDYRNFINNLKIRKNIIYIKGDEDKLKGDYDLIKIKNNGKRFILLHGHQYINERNEYSIAKILKKINDDIPPFLFCISFRILLRNFKDTIILGHSHALRYFKAINCVNSGTLSNIVNLYNDRGYVVIENGNVRLVESKV
ncbi:metallophosphoesterase [Sulfolobus sp. E5-1-F]|uniref:metallophosphoesterase n=1 Tax=Sulfolobaceae TaxID=118883 RepID=UPI0012978DCB|nr:MULTISPECIES: metallophosphoesterase [unclassified Sulfolobus]QGA53681.1 metallophosphoesterase [Sulfolobus sp. E5-1-F]QGA68665.1 metallophosphoesterase [Sulfolobus sp. E11-6]